MRRQRRPRVRRQRRAIENRLHPGDRGSPFVEGFTPVGGVHPGSGWWGSPRFVGFTPVLGGPPRLSSLRRNKGGGNGKNCGVINVEFFAKAGDSWFGKDLYGLVSEEALKHSSGLQFTVCEDTAGTPPTGVNPTNKG